MVECADRAVRRNDPAMRGLLTQIASIASEYSMAFPSILRIAADRDGVFPQFRTARWGYCLRCLSQGTQSVLRG